MRQIKWKRGAGTLFLGLCLCMLMLFFMVMIMEFSSIQYTRTVSMTRSDAIADSVAVYAQSYDYKYNKRQAEVMAEMLSTYNNGASSKYNVETNISFPEDDVLTVECKTSTKPFYPDLILDDLISIQSKSTVKSVDIYGDIFVVPGDLAEEKHKDMEKDDGEVVTDSNPVETVS